MNFFHKKIKKPDLYESEIDDIFDKHSRDEWIPFIEKYLDYEIYNGYIIIHNVSNIDHYTIFCTLEELRIKRFSFTIGDIVKHNILGGLFVIYDYPCLDERADPNTFKMSSKLSFDCQHYYVDGFLDDGSRAGTFLESFDGEEAKFLGDDDCHWSKFTKVSDITTYENAEPFWEYLLDYYKSKEEVLRLRGL